MRLPGGVDRKPLTKSNSGPATQARHPLQQQQQNLPMPPAVAENQAAKMKVAVLKAALDKRQLGTSGLKAALVARLVEYSPSPDHVMGSNSDEEVSGSEDMQDPLPPLVDVTEASPFVPQIRHLPWPMAPDLKHTTDVTDGCAKQYAGNKHFHQIAIAKRDHKIGKSHVKNVTHHGKSSSDGESNDPKQIIKEGMRSGHLVDPGTRELALYLAQARHAPVTPGSKKRGWWASDMIFLGYFILQ